jgi:hypothetical protein
LGAFPGARLFFRDAVEEVFYRPGYDAGDGVVDLHVEARAHGVGLPGAGLPVGEDRCVVAVKGALDEPRDAGLVDRALVRARVEDVVVGEGLVRAEEHLGLARRHLGADPAHVDHLARHLRPDPVKFNATLESFAYLLPGSWRGDFFTIRIFLLSSVQAFPTAELKSSFDTQHFEPVNLSLHLANYTLQHVYKIGFNSVIYVNSFHIGDTRYIS